MWSGVSPRTQANIALVSSAPARRAVRSCPNDCLDKIIGLGSTCVGMTCEARGWYKWCGDKWSFDCMVVTMDRKALADGKQCCVAYSKIDCGLDSYSGKPSRYNGAEALHVRERARTNALTMWQRKGASKGVSPSSSKKRLKCSTPVADRNTLRSLRITLLPSGGGGGSRLWLLCLSLSLGPVDTPLGATWTWRRHIPSSAARSKPCWFHGATINASPSRRFNAR